MARRPAPKQRDAYPSGVPASPDARPERRCDVLVVGAGAAGIFAALAARGAIGPDGGPRPVARDAPDVVLLNNESRLGLKILVSGGGRCNLTNTQVDEHDYDTDSPKLLRGALRGFSAEVARAYFEQRGCRTYAEPLGKVFPKSNRAQEVLSVLLTDVQRAGVPLIAPAEVVGLVPPAGPDAPWQARLADGATWTAERVVLATGGKSLPKTGSRGFGLEALAALGHDLAPALPALTPLLFDPAGPLHGLAGLTAPMTLTLAPRSASADQLAGKKFRPWARAAGSALVTHKGATGPAPFDVSGAAGRALLAGEQVALRADVWSLAQPGSPWAPFKDDAKLPGASLPPADAPRPPTREQFAAQTASLLARRDASLQQAFGKQLPRSLLTALLRAADLDPAAPIKQLGQRLTAQLHLALTQADLHLIGAEGYAKAEVTTGGVLLADLTRSLESRRHPRLHCCGEVVNVTGRLGGFNFQWAWASGYAAGRGVAKALQASA